MDERQTLNPTVLAETQNEVNIIVHTINGLQCFSSIDNDLVLHVLSLLQAAKHAKIVQS